VQSFLLLAGENGADGMRNEEFGMQNVDCGLCVVCFCVSPEASQKCYLPFPFVGQMPWETMQSSLAVLHQHFA